MSLARSAQLRTETARRLLFSPIFVHQKSRKKYSLSCCSADSKEFMPCDDILTRSVVGCEYFQFSSLKNIWTESMNIVLWLVAAASVALSHLASRARFTRSLGAHKYLNKCLLSDVIFA